MRLSIVNILAGGAHHGIVLIHYPNDIDTDNGMTGKLTTIEKKINNFKYEREEIRL